MDINLILYWRSLLKFIDIDYSIFLCHISAKFLSLLCVAGGLGYCGTKTNAIIIARLRGNNGEAT